METEPHLGDIDIATVKTRSVSGIVTLISRSFVQRLISTGGFFLLSIFLARPEIGLFIAINEVVSILGYFSDVGLAASLIRKREKISISELRTTFTIQQIIVLTLLVIALVLSPKLINYYHIQGSGVFLFFSLLLAFFLSSLKTIPSVILERQLKFGTLATVEVAESIAFYTLSVFLAWKGWGVSAYAVGVLGRSLLGTFVLYRLSPWPIGLSIHRPDLKPLLAFGLPYQLNSLLAVVKDRFTSAFLWKVIGADGVGIIGWAQTWSQLPLRFIMDNVTKVTFPALAHMQSNPQELKRAIEKSLLFTTFFTFPLFSGMAVLTPQLVKIIPNYSKWEPALLPLALLCFNSAFAAVSTPLTNVLNAIGKIKINTYLMIMWTVLTWTLVPYLSIKYGYRGTAYATALIALSSIVPVVIVKRYTGFSLLNSVGKPFLAMLGLLIISVVLSRVLPSTLPSLILTIFVSGLVYLLIVIALVGQEFLIDAQKILSRK